MTILASAVMGVPTAYAVPAQSIPHDGTYMVGSDIAPGRYFTSGGISGDPCIWQRLSAVDDPGDFSNIIDSGMSTGQQYVDIKPTDKAFKTQSCQPWLQK
jgi:hypothetical protein